MQEPIKERVAKLRGEIEQIREANRKHLLMGRRRWDAESEHQRRGERLREILNELASLTDWRKS
jgi:hypothetical protein